MQLLGARDPEVRGSPFALAFSTPPFVGYGAAQDMAKGIDAALARLAADDRPVALVFGQNVGQVIGGMLSAKWNMPCIDEVSAVRVGFHRCRRSGAGRGFRAGGDQEFGVRCVTVRPWSWLDSANLHG